MLKGEYFWTVVILLGIGTLGIRASFLFLYNHIRLPEGLKSSFSLIPASVLPALIMPSVVFYQGGVSVLGGKERVVALVVASLFCFKSKNIFLSIVVGLGALFLLRWSFGVI